MSEKRTIYAVSSGEYSDYGVDILFEDEKDAQRHAERMNQGSRYTSFHVEEFTLVASGTKRREVTWYSAGAWSPTWKVEVREHIEVAYGEDPTSPVSAPAVEESAGYVHAWAMDREWVLKVVSDRAAKRKATDAGIA